METVNFSESSPMKNFQIRDILPAVIKVLRGSALLEYQKADLEYLQIERADHHYGDWDEIYRSIGGTKPLYDLWLDKYSDVLKESLHIPVIDLGCGYGNDTLYLRERGYRVISCDLSSQALNRLSYFIDKPQTRRFDMLDGLPFESGSAKIVIADLSIHYFLWKDTKRIVEEIKRVLKGGGHLLCRVNSASGQVTDNNRYTKIEDGYYDFGGRKKRFFLKDHLEELFSDWETVLLQESCFKRFGSSKVLWETAQRKPVGE